MVSLSYIIENKEKIRKMAEAHRFSKIRVFGSVARGEETELSDVDFVVDPNEDANLFDLGGLVMELEEFLGTPTDVISSRSLGEKIKKSIERDGIEL
ncbi:nucleotidyltransferase family protein [Pseudomonas sp. S1(2024)]|uniref:nucleotidyltransferase family protein n=1 Tax=Pseudomonas sp. S1(2024) TaxID=3390191 RepID=UPI00397933F6